jgi:NAD(P) transhydrogenase subunit beta
VDVRGTAISFSYLVATVLFILGLRFLSSPRTAREGNRLAAIGMLIATVATLLDRDVVWFRAIVVAIPLGAVVGVVAARRVAMTAMPQMVALFNGCGGAAAATVSVAEWARVAAPGAFDAAGAAAIAMGTAIGAVSFTGSLVAFGKLQEVLPTRPLMFPLQRSVSLAVVLASLALAVTLVAGTGGVGALWLLFGASLLLGILGTLPIGGGDMPVVIAVLNSMTGLATALTGVVLENEMLVVAGVLVGASGMLLTMLMSRAMNRSLANVLFGGFGASSSQEHAGAVALVARPTTVEDSAIALAYARRVVIVPGYGMAVAQAQHELQAVAESLIARGVDVTYAIHPVAGRMPGHMNVLLAEANVPYERLVEMDQVNSSLPQADVVLVVGANDVVNPAAREDPTSPIHGMPIIDADRARLAIVLKRGMSVGFAGIDNALFYRDNTRMLFGDAKQSLRQLVEALKAA